MRHLTGLIKSSLDKDNLNNAKWIRLILMSQLMNLLSEYRKSINPPYSSKDFLTVGLTLLILFVATVFVANLPNRFKTEQTSQSKASTLYETKTYPEGTVINIYISGVPADAVYNVLKANGLQANVLLARVDLVESGYTVSNVGGHTSTGSDGTISYFADPAAIQIQKSDWDAHPYFSLGHEYGHVWSNYYKWTYWQGSWDEYLKARGVYNDPRLAPGTTSCWNPEEFIAQDYWWLFGAPETTQGVIVAWCPSDAPKPQDVPGLRDYLALTWTHNNPPPNYLSGTITPTSSVSTPTPTRTPTPTSSIPTPISNDATSPTVSITSPLNGSTLAVRSTINIQATASDNVGVAKVEFWVNGRLNCSDTAAPYSCSWKISGAKNRTYTISARAYDAAGNTSNSSVTVTAR